MDFRELLFEFEKACRGVRPELAIPAADEGLQGSWEVLGFQEIYGVAGGGLGDDDVVEFFGGDPVVECAFE